MNTNNTEKPKFKWWGYKHVNGNLQVKRFFDRRDIDDARESPFCDVVVNPFLASDRDDALEEIKKILD